MTRTAPDGGSAVGIFGPEYDDGLSACQVCGEAISEPHVEAWDRFEKLVCGDCADALFEQEADALFDTSADQ